MAKWKIYPLMFGWLKGAKSLLTTGLDENIELTIPYLGFYLTDGKHKVLVDNGINSKYIVDGKAWAGRPASGGEEDVIRELKRVGVTCDEIEYVLYTHLHNDHAGNCHLFTKALHVFQNDEWKELLEPLPSMKIRGDFDMSLAAVLRGLKTQKIVGDIENYLPGISFLLTPGHTKGSMSLIVETKDGRYLLAGDTMHITHTAYSYQTKMELIDGSIIDVTPAPHGWEDIAPSSLVYDHYAWYDSIYRLKAMFPDPKYVLTGHGPELVNKVFG